LRPVIKRRFDFFEMLCLLGNARPRAVVSRFMCEQQAAKTVHLQITSNGAVRDHAVVAVDGTPVGNIRSAGKEHHREDRILRPRMI